MGMSPVRTLCCGGYLDEKRTDIPSAPVSYHPIYLKMEILYRNTLSVYRILVLKKSRSIVKWGC